MSILYVCAVCVETGNNEWCGHEDRNDLRVMPDGRWVCDGCYDEMKWELLTDQGDEDAEPIGWHAMKAPPEYVEGKAEIEDK